MLTYNQAKMLLLRGRNGRKKVGNNTWLRWTDINDISVVLYNTFVVTIKENDTYILNSGGFRTATTRNRINQFSPARVFQRNGRWFVRGAAADWYFRDGMTVSSNGRPIVQLQPHNTYRLHNVTTDTDSDSRGPA